MSAPRVVNHGGDFKQVLVQLPPIPELRVVVSPTPPPPWQSGWWGTVTATAGKGLQGSHGDYSHVITCKENPVSSMWSWQQRWWLHTVFHYTFLVKLLLVLTSGSLVSTLLCLGLTFLFIYFLSWQNGWIISERPWRKWYYWVTF